MFKLSPQLLGWSRLLHNNIYRCYNPHLMTTHNAELTIKATRRTFLNKAVLNQSKDVIYGEVRKPSDFVLKLKQAGKCPAVIIPYSKNKQQQIDIVVEGKAMKTRSNSPQYPLERVHVRVEGKDHLCVLNKVSFNIKNFIEKVYFQEYVPGKANYLTVPVNVTHLQENTFFHKGYTFDILVEKLDIICYNYEYPTRLYVDVTYVNQDRPYKIGDLANTFPPGIILNPKVDPNKSIFEFNKQENDRVGARTIQQVMDNLNYGKEKEKEKAKPAAGATGTAAVAGKGDAKADAGKADASKKADTPKADGGKKKK